MREVDLGIYPDLVTPAYTKTGRKFKRNPEVRWRIETSVEDVLSLDDEAKAKFENDTLAWEVELKAMQKNSPSWYRNSTVPALT